MVRFDLCLGEGHTLRNASALLAAALACSSSYAQEAPPVLLDTVVVSAMRGEARIFDIPAAIGSVDADTIRTAGPQVNLSEALSRVPGITVLNRQNYAQDLQLSIRGFGSRSTFGIRGVRLIVDGIPATMPDGQGQASNVSLPSTARIEVLRGPLALLYGNAAGGVVQAFTEAGAPQPTASATATAGSFDMRRYGATFAATAGENRYIIDASHFSTDGYRDHSSAERDQLNAKWTWQVCAQTRVDLVLNSLKQDALDPLGLTRAQWEADPRQAPAIAYAQDASKDVRQTQLGALLEQRYANGLVFNGRAYYGTRNLDNKLSTPLANQLPPTSSGGIVTFDRDYYGAGAELSKRFALEGGVSMRLLGGLYYDRMKDDRQGYINNAGERGDLRRDEDDLVYDTDALLQATFDFGDRWSAVAGVRASRVRFETTDRYIATGNPDDSGSLKYTGTNPVAGVTWHASRDLNVYANAGRGFETPTFTELAYRNNATGLNTDLKASTSNHFELGMKWRPATGQALEVATFDIRTRDEIVVDVNTGGRSTFRNAGSTTRRGAEGSWQATWARSFSTLVSASVLNARFENGNHLPGTPQRSLFAEAVWSPQENWHAAVEIVHNGRIYVNDANDDSAAAATVVNLRVGGTFRFGAVEILPVLRLENAGDRKYAGSVIVNEANRRFFESAPTRAWMASLAARYRF
jgi:iron complex outermembrane receptor protein